MTFEEADYPLLKYAYTRSRLAFWVINGVTIGANVTLFISGFGHWSALAIGVAVEAIYWIGNYGHRARLREIELIEPYNPLHHYDDVCEGCNPVKMRDGKSPITNVVWYWAAVNNITREVAQTHVDDNLRGPLIRKRHANYLASKEFT